MREMMMLLKANIRSAKKSFISVAVLLFIVSLSVTSVMSVRANSATRVGEAMEKDGFGDLWVAFVDVDTEKKGMTTEELKQKTQACQVVEKVNSNEIIWINDWTINESNSNNSLMFMVQGAGGINFDFFESDGKQLSDKTPELEKGQIAVPIAFQSLYGCKLGDTLQIGIHGEPYDMEVEYFIEDPLMGCSMMGLKTFLISEEDMEFFKGSCQESSKEDSILQGTVFHIFQTKAAKLSGVQLEQEINKETGLTSYAQIKLTASQARNYMLLLVNIFSGILLVFVVLLVIVALIIIGHSISNSMEMDYVNMGVLKAVGFTNIKLKVVYVLLYTLAVLLGNILGFPCAIPVISMVNEMTKPVTGLQVSSGIAYGLCMGILLGLSIVIVLFVIFKLRKISKITPVRAIRGGREAVYFKSRLQAGIHKKGLDFWMAFRQVTSHKQQYVSGCLIAALLVFFLGITSSTKTFIGSDGEKMNALFSAYEEDFGIRYYDKSVQVEVEELIQSYSEIQSNFGVAHMYLSIEGSQINALVVEKPEAIQNILKGRVCRYDNEIVITEFLAKELGVEMGDSLTVQSGEHKEEFLISGYYQNANDMGSNFAMTLDGYERLVDKENDNMWFRIYNIKDQSKVETICEQLKNEYPEDVIDVSFGTFSGLDSIVSAVDAIAVLIYVIATIFVLIAVLLICSKLFLKEQKDYGIYKAIGFDSGRLRRQFAVRFSVVAMIGGMLGIVLYLLAGNLFASTIFYFVGVSSFEADTGLLPMVIPFVFVAGLFGIFSWMAAGRIRKTTPRILIQE